MSVPLQWTRARGDLAAAVLALLVLVALEASGADMLLAHTMAGPQGFTGRHSALLAQLHTAGRALCWVLLAALVVQTLRAPADRAAGAAAWGRSASVPTRGQRWAWLGVIMGSAVLVPGLKRFSRSSCPWDLAPFGGGVPYVPHWLLNLADGGPGHCFPSGHAAGMFAFIGLYFLWREHRPPRARAWAAGVWLLGAGFGVVQMLRGAHFLSHVLWSAWACWVLAALAAALLARRAAARGEQRAAARAPQASNKSPGVPAASGRTGATSPR